MPPLVVPSPVVLDHSFPRSDTDLKIAAIALGQLVQNAAGGHLQVVVTDAMREFTEAFDWSSNTPALLVEIYRLHAQLLLRETRLTVLIDVSGERSGEPHPLPCGLDGSQGLAELWAHDVGRLRQMHDRAVRGRPGFLGVACAEAWSGVTASACPTPGAEAAESLVVVGPEEMRALEDAYVPEARSAPVGARISVATAIRNIGVLGGVVQAQRGSSHIQVKFAGGRTWPLDTNDDPIPDAYLDELKPLTGLPLPVIRSVLYYGERPSLRCRLN